MISLYRGAHAKTWQQLSAVATLRIASLHRKSRRGGTNNVKSCHHNIHHSVITLFDHHLANFKLAQEFRKEGNCFVIFIAEPALPYFHISFQNLNSCHFQKEHKPKYEEWPLSFPSDSGLLTWFFNTVKWPTELNAEISDLQFEFTQTICTFKTNNLVYMCRQLVAALLQCYKLCFS